MKSKIKYASIVLFISVVFISVSSFSFPPQIETKDGVRIVHNEKEGKWRENNRVSIKLVKTLGGIDVEDENFAFTYPYDIALDASGNMYVVDDGNCRIQKFSPEGKYLATIGKRGQGPVEFQGPFSIDIDSKGYLYISDPPARKLHILTPEGKEHNTIIITEFLFNKVRCLNSDSLVFGSRVTFDWLFSEKKKLPRLFIVSDLKGNYLFEAGNVLDYKDDLVTVHGNSYDFEVDCDANFFLAFRYQNRIEKYSPEGKLIWKADRALNYGTKPLDMGHIEKGKRGVGFQVPRMNMVSSGIAVDEKKRVWVATLNRQLTMEESYAMGKIPTKEGEKFIESPEKIDAYKLEVFNKEGILLGEIPLSHRVHGMRIYGNYLFLWERNFSKYYQYEIIEK